MRATFLHKNIEVAYIEYESGMITQIRQILKPEHTTYSAGMTKDIRRNPL